MFTFTIVKGEIVPTPGTPDFVFQLNEFEKFKANKELFEEKFPGKLFGCVENLESTYTLNEETKVPLEELDAIELGVYFGICRG